MNPPAMQETWVGFLGCEDALEKEMATRSSIFAWEIHGQRNLMGYSPTGRKEVDMTTDWTQKYTVYLKALDSRKNSNINKHQ